LEGGVSYYKRVFWMQAVLALLCFGHAIYDWFFSQHGLGVAFVLCGVANALLAMDKWKYLGRKSDDRPKENACSGDAGIGSIQETQER
jgi:hypothetical protein